MTDWDETSLQAALAEALEEKGKQFFYVPENYVYIPISIHHC